MKKLIFIIIFSYLKIIVTQLQNNIPIGVKQKHISIEKNCQESVIYTNYKHLKLQIKNIKNIDKLIITDKPMIDCNINECHANSTICQIRSVTDNSETLFSTKMCIEAFYLYPYSETLNETSFELSTEYVIGGNCEYIHQNPFAYCGESNLDDCRNCLRQGCTIIQCGIDTTSAERTSLYNNNKFTKMYELCIPYTVSNEEKLKRCKAFNGVNQFHSSGTCEYDDLEGYSSMSIFLIGLSVIIVLIFSFSVIYYNIHLVKYQTPPFLVPDFFPEFLFPRKANPDRTTVDHKLEKIFSAD